VALVVGEIVGIGIFLTPVFFYVIQWFKDWREGTG